MFSPSQEQLASSSSSEFYLFNYMLQRQTVIPQLYVALSSHNKVFTLYVPNKHMLVLFANPVEKHRVSELKRIQQLSPSFKILEINAFRHVFQFTSVPTHFYLTRAISTLTCLWGIHSCHCDWRYEGLYSRGLCWVVWNTMDHLSDIARR